MPRDRYARKYAHKGWGSWPTSKPKKKISPAALNYPKSKILKMLKEQYVSVEKIEITKKEIVGEDWDDLEYWDSYEIKK
jgi:hypothetical protein